MILLTEATSRLESLSEERAQMVLRLIEDLAALEALENAGDLAAARLALADPETVPWTSLRGKLDEIHR